MLVMKGIAYIDGKIKIWTNKENKKNKYNFNLYLF